MKRWLLRLGMVLACVSGALPGVAADEPAVATAGREAAALAGSWPVMDRAGVLADGRLEEIRTELEAARAREGLDVLVVTLKEAPGEGVEEWARQLAVQHCHPLFHCVVVYVAGDPGTLRILPGGKLLRLFVAESIRETVSHAERRAGCELTASGKVRAAATEAVDLLRVWAGDGRFWTLPPVPRRTAWLEGLASGWASPALTVVAGGLLLLGAALLLARMAKRRNRSHSMRRFAAPPIQPRLGAPYAGGNDVIGGLG